MSTVVKHLLDENGIRYDIQTKLGGGGQGATYTVSDPAILIKRPFAGTSYEDYSAAVHYVRSLPIPDYVHIARPVYLLYPVPGYVMRFMENMTDLNSLVCDFQDAPDNYKIPYYIKTGGMRRRLRILKGLAEILYQLRERNLVYCDLSYNNVFISKNVSDSEVWLIDADNLRFSDKESSPFGSPECKAPEVCFGHQNTVFSDIYSFALISYLFLTGQKPFCGRIINLNLNYNEEDKTEDASSEDDWGVEDDWGEEVDDWGEDDGSNINVASHKSETRDDGRRKGWSVYECAEAGLYPWIDDPDNRDNCCENVGIRHAVINDELFACFHQTFCYIGRKQPETRPSPAKWYHAFLRAEKQTVDCTCGWSFYYQNRRCPLCGKSLPLLFVAVTYDIRKDSEGNEKRIERNRHIVIPGQLTEICASDLCLLPTNKLIEHDTKFFTLFQGNEKRAEWTLVQNAELTCEMSEGENTYKSALGTKLNTISLERLQIRIPILGGCTRMIEFQCIPPQERQG